MQLSQQASYKAEIHELYAEMLSMREKSEMQAAMSAQTRRLESLSLTVESEPENVLNTASPSRCSSWILPSEMMITPDRPTTSGLQTPTGAPVQLGPSPVTQQYSRRSDLSIPPAQWGNQDGQEEGEKECELFRDPLQVEGDPVEALLEHDRGMEHQDDLHIAMVPVPSNHDISSQAGRRCVNGQLVRPEPPRDDSPSTACNSSTVTASRGARLGRADLPCFGQPPPGIVQAPSMQLPPPPTPPPTSCRRSPTASAELYPRRHP